MKISPLFCAGLSLLIFPICTSAQDPLDSPVAVERVPPKHIQCVYEAFSMPKSEAAELQRAGHSDQMFYEVLVAATIDKKLKQEKLIAIRSVAGMTATVTQGSDLIFPTEFNPPELPNSMGIPLQVKTVDAEGKPKDPEPSEVNSGTPTLFPSTPATPTAFDTSVAGDEFEIDASMNATGSIIGLRFNYSCNRLIAMDAWGQGLSETKVPRFSNQNQKSSLTVKSGIPVLLGTVSPVLEAQDPETPERVWFAFLTTTVIKSSE